MQDKLSSLIVSEYSGRSFGELQDLFNEALKKEHFPEHPLELYQPFEYILRLGGKRIRPVMLLMASEMFGTKAEKALPQAIAIELFHNFTLIHDDIMDNAPLRRGLSTVHEKYNTPVAILSGDAMLVYAYRYLIRADEDLLASLILLFNDCAIKVCEGQQLDMNFESISGLTLQEYLHMIELKTATLIATTLKIGAILGKASHKDADNMYSFGLKLGICFQLKDDWLDSFGDTEKLGKQPGGDIIQNKKTWIFIEALNSGDEALRKKLVDLYSVRPADPRDKVEEVQSIFRKLNVDKKALAEIRSHFNSALEYLDAVSLPVEQRNSIKKLAEDLLNRDH